MSAQHTPGPWAVDEDSFGYIIVQAKPSSRGEDYWSFDGITVVEGIEREANARLIAAPELLEACIAALPVLRTHFAQTAFPVRDQLIAAIAKARGEA